MTAEYCLSLGLTSCTLQFIRVYHLTVMRRAGLYTVGPRSLCSSCTIAGCVESSPVFRWCRWGSCTRPVSANEIFLSSTSSAIICTLNSAALKLFFRGVHKTIHKRCHPHGSHTDLTQSAMRPNATVQCDPALLCVHLKGAIREPLSVI